ncbi:ATP-binding protein [Acidipropionibacterium timonense]|uniref:ATP-binding protein n=1 Tax=Acidipropionibacterium timonense TaxID=2161818 RepID=UPI0010308618|nr:ATP-binding protein [Acidipropionibacterium timonense]
MEWSDDQLRQTLADLRARRGDTTLIEVKHASGGVPKVSDTLCAFANMPDGGTILLGIDEAHGRFDVVGVKDVAAVEAGIAGQARDAVQPSPHLEFQTLTIDGTPVEIVHVSPLRIADKPARVGDRAFLRQADGDYPMQLHELRMLEVAKLHVDEQIDYDLAPATGRRMEDLEPDLVTAYLTAVRAHDGRLRHHADEQILRMTNVLSASGEPTLAGLYALGEYPQGQYPALTVTAAVQLPGGEGQARNRNLQDFTGPLPVLLSDLIAWVERNLDSVRRYRPDGHMEAVPELPLNAVRELISNALVHRDLGPNTLGLGKQIQIRLTPSCLFIQNPGGLRGVSLAQLESVEHAQAAVNQRLYQIAKRLRTADGASVIEGEGGGIREVFHSTAARGLPRPQLIDTGVQFKALLWRSREDVVEPPAPQPSSPTPIRQRPDPSPANATRNVERVLGALRADDDLTIHDLVRNTGLTIGQVRYALRAPLAEGIVVMAGGQGVRSTTYRITPH